MIANPDISYGGSVPHPFTLNDLRVHNTIEEEPSPSSALTVAGLAVAAVLAIGGFIWLDPLHLFTPNEAGPPAQALAPSTEPVRPIERQEIVAPLTPAPAAKSLEAPSLPAPAARAPQVQAPAVQPPAATVKPESRGNSMGKTNTTISKASPKEKAAAPVLLSKPEETTAPSALPIEPEKTAPTALLAKPEDKTATPPLPTKPEEKADTPIVPKLGDDTKNASKPAVANEPTPAPE